MAIVKELDQHYVDNSLRCPDGKARIEIVDPQRTGMYIQVRAHRPGEGTYYLRYKDSHGKTCHEQIGRTRDMTLESARSAALRRKAELSQGAARVAEEKSPELASPVQTNDVQNSSAAASAPAAAGGMTLDAFMTDLYFPHAKVHKRSWTRDEQLYRLRIKAKFGHLPLAHIARKAVSQFKIALLGEGLSKSSVNHHIQLMRHVLNLAVSWEELDRNVLEGIELLHLENQVENYLDDAAVDRFEEVLKSDKNRSVCLILMFLLSTGARLGEVLTAEWRQVSGMVWTIPAMNTKAKRMKALPLNPSARWVLEQLTSKGESPYLFPSPATGRPYTTITRAFWRLRGKAGIPDNVRIHDLRHTFASRVVSGGRSLFEAQKLLGHADPRTTMRYAHLSMAAMHDASNVASLRAGR